MQLHNSPVCSYIKMPPIKIPWHNPYPVPLFLLRFNVYLLSFILGHLKKMVGITEVGVGVRVQVRVQVGVQVG